MISKWSNVYVEDARGRKHRLIEVIGYEADGRVEVVVDTLARSNRWFVRAEKITLGA